MIPALLVALAALAGPAADALPRGEARYRVEILGAPVGVAALSVVCGPPGACRLAWTTSLRLPDEAGGAVRIRRLVVPVAADGRATGPASLEVDGERRELPLSPGTVPASAAELLLPRVETGRCLEATQEETGRSGAACAGPAAPGEPRQLTIVDEVESVRPGADGFPDEVELPAQRARYVRDARAAVPARVPLSVRVPGPEEVRAARRFCGREPDPPQPAVAGGDLPPAHPGAGSCQVQAAAYAAAARARGLEARTALGVAHDGAGFVWHAWVEVRAGSGWVAIDPAFGQAPARGPRFTVARMGPDAASQRAAGRRILACWGEPVE